MPRNVLHAGELAFNIVDSAGAPLVHTASNLNLTFARTGTANQFKMTLTCIVVADQVNNGSADTPVSVACGIFNPATGNQVQNGQFGFNIKYDNTNQVIVFTPKAADITTLGDKGERGTTLVEEKKEHKNHPPH